MTVRVFAVDPGSKLCGWALLDVAASTASFLSAGHSRVDDTLDRLRWFATQGPLRVAIERVGLAHREEARHALIQTSHVAGQCESLARELVGDAVDLLTAIEWRRALTGRGNASDAMIKTVVLARVTDIGRRTNAHVRDAMGIGLVAGARFGMRGGNRGTARLSAP